MYRGVFDNNAFIEHMLEELTKLGVNEELIKEAGAYCKAVKSEGTYAMKPCYHRFDDNLVLDTLYPGSLRLTFKGESIYTLSLPTTDGGDISLTSCIYRLHDITTMVNSYVKDNFLLRVYNRDNRQNLCMYALLKSYKIPHKMVVTVDDDSDRFDHKAEVYVHGNHAWPITLNGKAAIKTYLDEQPAQKELGDIVKGILPSWEVECRQVANEHDGTIWRIDISRSISGYNYKYGFLVKVDASGTVVKLSAKQDDKDTFLTSVKTSPYDDVKSTFTYVYTGGKYDLLLDALATISNNFVDC